MRVLCFVSMAAAAAAAHCPKSTPPAAVAVPGYGTSMRGCIGAQRKSATQQLAVSVDCGANTKLNVTAAAAQVGALCSDTPGCAAFSIISPDYPNSKAAGRLLCEIHPETIAEDSETNVWWSVWEADDKPREGRWPYAPGQGPPPPPPPPPASYLGWDTPSTSVTGSMPLGNGQLGVNVYADAAGVVWLLLSHVDALDENTNLDKLGRVKIEVTSLSPSGPQPSSGAAGPFIKQTMHLENATVRIDLQSGVSSHRRDCHSDAPPSRFSRCFNRDAEGVSAK